METGKPTQILGNWLHLSTLSDWRFINLNQSFEDALNLTVTQSLGQVYYVPQGRERWAFSPTRENFYEVQDNHWEEVEITLKELNGNLVEFQSDSQCVIQLHFRIKTRHFKCKQNLISNKEKKKLKF